MSKNKKKLGYRQYEELLSDAHYKLELLAQKYSELQAYFIGYVEFGGHSLEFNDWMKNRLEELKKEYQENEQSKKEGSLVNEEV
tara:strand:+ start:405 stop:656 length:252 start_codon:yes stop_codon:yes gene_type:complete